MSVDVSVLQNLKAPTKLALLIAAGCVAVCVAVLVLAVLPTRTQVYTLRTEVAGLNATLANMKTDIAGTEQQRAKTDALTKERDTLLASGEIEPLLGSLAMRGKALLDPVAQQTGFAIENVKELPLLPLQVPSPAPEQLYGRQPIEFTGKGSFAQIVAFIAAVEEQQPLATLSGLLVLSQPQTPEIHKAIVTFEWPAKGEKQKTPAAKPAP